jgi:hypothetical protein
MRMVLFDIAGYQRLGLWDWFQKENHLLCGLYRCESEWQIHTYQENGENGGERLGQLHRTDGNTVWPNCERWHLLQMFIHCDCSLAMTTKLRLLNRLGSFLCVVFLFVSRTAMYKPFPSGKRNELPTGTNSQTVAS